MTVHDPRAAAGAPYRSTPRRRRRWPIVVLVFLVLLAAIFVVADRLAASAAQDRVATRLAGQRPFAGKPTVRIHGFPFLTQALGGSYSDIELTGLGQPLAEMTGAEVDVALHGAHIPLSAVGNGVKTVPVDRVQVTVTVPLAELARVAGVPNLKLTSAGNDVIAQAPVNLPAVGSVTLSARVHLTISASGLDGSLSELKSVSGSLPASVANEAKQALKIHVNLPNLGFDSAVASVRASGSNVVFTGSARHVTLR